MANSWQAGAGLGEPDADGYYGWGGAASIRKNADGDWCCDGLATGGSSVELPLSASGAEAPLSELVDAFFSRLSESDSRPEPGPLSESDSLPEAGPAEKEG